MRRKPDVNDLYCLRYQISQSLRTIPKKNKSKFAMDLLTLIEKAHKEDYESFEL